MTAPVALVSELMGELERRGSRACVLGGVEQISLGRVDCDVDIAVDAASIRAVDCAVFEVAEQHRYSVILRVPHQIPTFVFYLLQSYEDERNLVKLDILADRIGINPLCVRAPDLVSGSTVVAGIRRPSAAMEAVWRIVKACMRTSWTSELVSRVNDALVDSGSKLAEMLRQIMGPHMAEDLLAAVRAGDVLRLNRMARRCYLQSRRRMLLRPPWKAAAWIASCAALAWVRLRRPSGIFVVLMGADGAGKTTLARELAKRFADWGYACRHMHWRPSVLPSLSSLVGRDPEVPEAARTPHLAEPKSRLLSALQFVYYMLDFELGYALRILPYRVKKSVVVVERYCYDFVVDSRRYNMVLPRFLARLGARIAPKPDLVLLVDGDEATLWNRKRELDPEELRRQIGLYRRFVRCCRNGHSIRSVGRSVEIVASDAMALICDVFRRRFAARRHGPLGGETGNSFRVLLGLPEQVVWADTSSGSFLRQLGLGDLLEGFEAALGGLEFAESGSAVVFPREPGRSFLSNDGYRVTARAWLNLAGRSSQDGCSLLRPIRVRGRVFWINPAFHSRLALWSPYTPFARLWNGLMRSELLGDCLLRGVCVAIKGATGSFLHRVLADACSPDFRVVASYAGTSAPASDRKVMLQIADKKGETLAYVKVAGRNRARRKLENEARVLRYLAQEGAVADRIPRLIRLVKGRRTTLLVSTPVPCPLRTVSSWSAVQENFLLHLHQRTRAIGRLTDMPLWNDMCRRLQIGRISHHHWADVLELSKDFIESRLGAIVRTYVLAHRDFAPWNMGMLPGGELFVLDWEDASSGGTPLHDYLHFILWPLALRSRSTIELSGIVSSSSFRRNLALRARSLGWPDLIPEAIGLYLLDVALDRLEACHESRLHPLGDALAAAYLVALERHLLACR